MAFVIKNWIGDNIFKTLNKVEIFPFIPKMGIMTGSKTKCLKEEAKGYLPE